MKIALLCLILIQTFSAFAQMRCHELLAKVWTRKQRLYMWVLSQMKTKIILSTLLFGCVSFGQTDCRTVLQKDLVVKEKVASRIEDTKKVILSALNQDGNQTNSVLSYMRMMIKKTQDQAIDLLMKNGASLAEIGEHKPAANVEKAYRLLEEFKSKTQGTSAENKGWFRNIVGKKEKSLVEIAEQLEKAEEALKAERTLLEKRVENLVQLIQTTELRIKALEDEIRFMKELYKWLLSIKDIEKHSTIVLHQFGLGIQDQITLLNQQVKSLEGQSEVLQKFANEINPSVLQIDQFLNISYPLIRSTLAVHLQGSNNKKKEQLPQVATTLTPEVMSQFFRPFHNGDQIRVVFSNTDKRMADRITPMKEVKYFYPFKSSLIGSFESTPSDSGWSFRITTIGQKKPSIFSKKTQPYVEVISQMNLNTGSRDVTRPKEGDGFHRYFYISNPVMEYNGIKVGDVVNLEPLQLELEGIRNVSYDFIFVGRVLGTRVASVEKIFYEQNIPHPLRKKAVEKMVGLQVFFYDPVSRHSIGNYLLEISENEFADVKLYKKSDEEL